MTDRLLKRRDFLAASKGLSKSMPGVVVQIRNRNDDLPARVGFTCTKKLGNAVARNRTRRRLKEAIRVSGTDAVLAGHDYVLIGRAGTANRTFEALKKDIISALAALHSSHRSQ
jgi:ribonuclease P protein component